MLVDSHCHLHDREFFEAKEAEECLKRAHKASVKKVICIGTSHEDSLVARDFASAHKNVYWTYGVHPEHASREKWLRYDFEVLPLAIGEVGLDYHYEGYDREAQIRLFEEMLQLAVDYELAASFHVREAFDDFFPVIKNFPTVHGVVHSFTDSKKVLRRILDETEFFVGVNGLATYSTLPVPPLERILLETDAPFLAPVPYRGEKSEPAHVAEVAKWLGEKLGVEPKVVAGTTTRNAEDLFGI